MSTTSDKFIEWVDALPPTWGANRLGSIATVKARLGWKGLKAEEYVDEGYIFLSTPNLKGEEIDFENVNYITKERYEESPEIMLRVGWLCGTGSLLMRPEQRVLNSKYLVTLFQLKRLKEALTLQSVGSTMDNLNTGILSRIGLPLPSLEEQSEILEFIEAESTKTERLLSAYTRQLELLTEYRAALIHESVTGQRAVPAIWLAEKPVGRYAALET